MNRSGQLGVGNNHSKRRGIRKEGQKSGKPLQEEMNVKTARRRMKTEEMSGYVLRILFELCESRGKRIFHI